MYNIVASNKATLFVYTKHVSCKKKNVIFIEQTSSIKIFKVQFLNKKDISQRRSPRLLQLQSSTLLIRKTPASNVDMENAL